MNTRAIVLDANILIRAVLGRRVRELILNNTATMRFFCAACLPDGCEEISAPLLDKRGIPRQVALDLLDCLEKVVEVLDLIKYRIKIL